MSEVITNLILAVIGVVATAAITIIIPAVKEWLSTVTTTEQQEIISILAKTAVYAAQQLYTENEDKLQYALGEVLAAINERGITVNGNEIRTAIEAALKEIKVSVSENGGEW